MKKPVPKKRKLQPLPLRPIGITLSQPEVDILAELAEEQSSLTGRTVSAACLIRALIRYAKRGIEAPALQDAIEEEFSAGRKWGVDELGKRQGRGRPRQ
jgi:hypothetical protein